jgi:hypothetical protein
MPPINQQGSRAGLITALVVFVILFVVSAVFAFQFYGKYKDKDKEVTDLTKNYQEYVRLPSPGASQTGGLADLMTAKNTMAGKFGITSNDTAMDVAIVEIKNLQTTIAGSAAVTPDLTADHAAALLKDTQSVLSKNGVTGVTMPPVSLEGAITALSNALVERQKTIGTLSSDLKTAQAERDAAKTDITTAAAASDAKLKDTQAADATSLAAAQQAATKNDAAMKTMQDDAAAAGAKVAADKAASDAELTAVTQKLTKANGDIEVLHGKLAARRVDVANNIVRQADAKIVRVPNNDVCYINLGFGDQVTAGLTFEVYDKAEGVPPIPDNATSDEHLPVGKASIEITHVGTTSSECRIVHLTPGAILQEGDVIANLVYDPHTKYNFFVYGKFDLANNGRPNDPDADVIKRLVTQWGGKLTDQVNVDTDFVVLGAEPVLPSFSKDEVTAENQKKLDDAQAALNKYQELANQAKELHIPILNQNRFLYYVGFYDQAKR